MRHRKSKQRGANSSQFDLFSEASSARVSAPSSTQVEAYKRRTSPKDPLTALVDYVLAPDRKRGRPEKALSVGPPGSDKRLLDVREAAQRLGLSKSTLDEMRCTGRGPRFIRATDRAVRYDQADLDAFAEERRRRSTSEDAIAALGA